MRAGTATRAPASRESQLARSRRCRPRARSAPASRAARWPSPPTASGAGTSTAKLGRCSSANASGSSPQASQMIRAISATVSSREAEMLKSSFSPAGELIAVTIPSAMSSTWVSVRVCSPEPKICSGRCPARTFSIRSGTAWAMPGSASGSLARAVGVERAADRVRQAVLVVGGAAVDLAGELGEAVGRAPAPGSPAGSPRASGTARALEHHRGGHVHEALDLEVERGADRRRCRARC